MFRTLVYDSPPLSGLHIRDSQVSNQQDYPGSVYQEPRTLHIKEETRESWSSADEDAANIWQEGEEWREVSSDI